MYTVKMPAPLVSVVCCMAAHNMCPVNSGFAKLMQGRALSIKVEQTSEQNTMSHLEREVLYIVLESLRSVY